MVSNENNNQNATSRANDGNICSKNVNFCFKMLIFVSECIINMIYLSLVLKYIFVAFDRLLLLYNI